jgi:hypothetical protein
MYLGMRFSHKIKKLLSGQGLASARKHTRRFFHRTRFPLETSRIIETFDGPDFQQIRQRYAVEDPGEDWPKYLDLDRWIDINIRRIREIELDLAQPKRILDLGCGAGYFLHIAQLLGHKGRSRCGLRADVWKSHACSESVALSRGLSLSRPISEENLISSPPS